ncbi:ceroid-lipofuscinosis neuronal protein 5-like [Haliotis rufescens]|uniref:ceroid-lipofuscinosis neuronal protein 5-like n=1 Tax=Haliotis rufescens TaxID=6454 RepID=UPI00201E851E|nr:ceroid-lipofuscinosis neuronal protein 5-like [Haliotis rufescens]
MWVTQMNLHLTFKMAAVGRLVLMWSCLAVTGIASAIEWPVPYRRFSSRPPANPYCQAGVIPFCPTGREANTMPTFQATDIIEVYALKAPVWEFKFGDLLAKFHIMHDAIGFKNLNTGLNYTMEWYELFQLFNCTFAHVLPNKTLEWCNQGATCIYDGIDDIHWSQNGTLAKVADITGQMFNDFAQWTLWDNKTGIFYETWTVENEPGGKMWFDSFDCASFVLRAFQKIGDLGGKFNNSVHLNYTRIHLYSNEPQYLGNASTLFGPGQNQTLVNDMLAFYGHFQSHQSIGHLMESLAEAYEEVYTSHRFYFFYNFEYWFLPMVEPYIKLTYYDVPLPGTQGYRRLPDY